MAVERPLTTSEAAAGLGVSRSTVKNWIKEFSLGAQRDARGDWRIDPEMVPIFEEVKRLRDEGLGLDSIRRVIGAPAPKPALVARFVPEEVAEVLEQAPAPAQVDMATFASALEHQNRLAMQLARLAHLNGQLQAQLKHLGAEVPRLQRQAAEVPKLKAQLALLAAAPGGADTEVLKAELEAAREEARQHVEASRAEAEASQAVVEELRARLEEREDQLESAREKIGELYKAKAPMGLAFPKADDALLDLQKELIRAKERIAQFEAKEYERDEAKRPWWNFWD
jgi:excisionase family DNA binding protein